MTLINKLLQQQDYLINDKPFVIKNALEDSSKYLSWKDVEYCINFPSKYTFDCINSNTQNKIEYSRYKPFWMHHYVPDKRELFDILLNGHTVSICNYGEHNELTNSLCKSLEDVFAVTTSIHAYCGYSESKSFRVHCDYPANFIIQCEGSTNWKVYNNKLSHLLVLKPTNRMICNDELEIAIDVDMEPGDLLYIPSRHYHCATPLTKRLSMSIPCVPLINEVQKLDRQIYSLLEV
jgi:ribosomal protein L16 Arg81 hydroxylase